MWCDRCQSDVQTDATASGTSLRCPQCGGIVAENAGRSEAVRQARAILDRWKSSDLLDRIGATESLPPLVWSTGRRDVETGPTDVALPNRLSLPNNSEPAPQSAEQHAESQDVNTDSTSAQADSQLITDTASNPQLNSGQPSTSSVIPAEREATITQTQRTPQPPPWLTTTVELSVGDDFDEPVVASKRPTPIGDQSEETSDSEEAVPENNDATQLNASQPFKANSADQPQRSPECAPPNTQIESIASSQSEQVTNSEVPAESAAIVTHDEPIRVQPESMETGFPAELAGLGTTKKLSKQFTRRPPVKRRPGPAGKSSTSSTGPVTVNRKFRVDQPGGKNIDGSQINKSSASDLVSGDTDSVPSSVAPDTRLVSNAASISATKRFRFDNAESLDDLTETDGSRTRTQHKPKQRYIDEAHGSAPRGPHFEISPPRRSNLTSMTGQFLAYIGVLGLTIGTAMVIYGHFGGYSEYTPTGWLVTTVAQMMLFLGVINLVSGGIEQNNDDVSRRINTLGEQLLRIEQVTEQALRGPKISPRIYANPEAAGSHTRTRENVETE